MKKLIFGSIEKNKTDERDAKSDNKGRRCLTFIYNSSRNLE